MDRKARISVWWDRVGLPSFLGFLIVCFVMSLAFGVFFVLRGLGWLPCP
jgi:hypothetical protein